MRKKGTGNGHNMSEDGALIKAIREALNAAPDNVVLRKHLAEMLVQQAAYDEAEKEFRAILDLTPEDEAVQTALASIFMQQEKWMVALVLLEKLLQASNVAAMVWQMSVKAYIETGNYSKAAKTYQRALQHDSTLADSELEDKLRPYMNAEPPAPVPDERIKVPIEEWIAPSEFLVEQSQTTFDNVGGMDRLKDEIQIKIIHPLKNPEIYRAYGKSIGGGILMYGPPGCGKTYIARASAGEVNAYFLSIGIHDVLNMYIGESEQNLHQLFEMARRNKPCIVFIDEIDALGANRNDMRHSAGRHTINQLLAELDGVGSANEGILVLAATNTPWHIDPALRRAGRFDQVIFVPPPDQKARAAILNVMLRDKPVNNLDLELVAKRTPGFSGADLKAVVDGAIDAKLRDALKQGVPAPIETSDLLKACKSVKPSTHDWFATARNYAVYSNQSGLYDDVMTYLNQNDDSNLLSRLTFWGDR